MLLSVDYLIKKETIFAVWTTIVAVKIFFTKLVTLTHDKLEPAYSRN